MRWHPPSGPSRKAPFRPLSKTQQASLLDGLALLAPLEALEDLGNDDADGNEEDDAEDDNDTNLPLSPVLALGQVHDSIAGDEGVNGGHFDCQV
jgi:hypothetical protein